MNLHIIARRMVKVKLKALKLCSCIFMAAFIAIVLSPDEAAGGEVKNVRIGVCLSLTGEFAEAGKKALAGIRLRLDDFNSRSEQTGVRLELVSRDDQSLIDRANEIIDELVTVEKVPAIIGPLSTRMMLAMVDTVQKHKVVLVSPTVTSAQIGKNGDWSFRLLYDDEFQGTVLARYLSGKVENCRAAVITNSRFSYGESMLKSFKKAMEENGGEVVAIERYEWILGDDDDTFNFLPHLERIAATDPDFVLLPVNSTEVAAIIRDSLRLDKRLKFCGGDTWEHENVLLSSGKNLEGSYYIGSVNFKSRDPAMDRYIELLNQSDDPDIQLTSILGYDALSLIIEGMKNGYDSETIRDTLYTIKQFPLASGAITVDPQRGSEKTAFVKKIYNHDSEDIIDYERNISDGGEYFLSIVIDVIMP